MAKHFTVSSGLVYGLCNMLTVFLRVFQCSALEQRAALLKQQGETRVSELERKLMEEQQTDTAEEVRLLPLQLYYTNKPINEV